MTTPLRKPLSIDEILNNEDFNIEDMIAECTGLLAKCMFEGHEDRADEYLAYLAALVKALLQEENEVVSDDCSADNPNISEVRAVAKKALAERRRKANEEPIPKEWATPV